MKTRIDVLKHAGEEGATHAVALRKSVYTYRPVFKSGVERKTYRKAGRAWECLLITDVSLIPDDALSILESIAELARTK